MKFIAIIPARYASTRFPGKPLARLGGKPVIQRVYEQVAGVLDDAVVATDDERIRAIDRFGAAAEITRFKGLGEISPDEFRGFIGPDMRLDRVTMRKEDGVAGLLEFYMGKNTSDRQGFIIDNLVVEDDSEIASK